MTTIDAKCRCGAIALKITGKPVVQLYCHCDDCQAAHGAAYVLSAIYPASAVEVERGKPTPMVVKATERMRHVSIFRDCAWACEVSARIFSPRESSIRNSMYNVSTPFFLWQIICLTIKAFRPRLAALKNLSTGRLYVVQLKRT